jgi:hypothetical protein
METNKILNKIIKLTKAVCSDRLSLEETELLIKCIELAYLEGKTQERETWKTKN